MGNLIDIKEFEPSVLEGKQFQLVDIEEREELNRKVENLSWDDMLEKLRALEAQGITNFINVKSNVLETLKFYLKEMGI